MVCKEIIHVMDSPSKNVTFPANVTIPCKQMSQVLYKQMS